IFRPLESFIKRKRRCEDWLDLSQVTEPEERLLIEAAQKDPSRFAELYEQNFHRVYAYIARRVRDRAETQDLTAHVFHQALANLGKFKWKARHSPRGFTGSLRTRLPIRLSERCVSRVINQIPFLKAQLQQIWKKWNVGLVCLAQSTNSQRTSVA